MIRDLFPYIRLVLKVNLSSYLDMVPSFSADNVTTCVARMLSWGDEKACKATWVVHVCKTLGTRMAVSRAS